MRLLARCLAVWLFAIFLIAGAVPLSSASAQTTSSTSVIGEPYYDRWEVIATRAEEMLERETEADRAFEFLRIQLVQWRERFLEAQSLNADQIETLRSQIEALGPAPEDGSSEAPEVAARRATLQTQLNTAEAPSLQADEGFARANGLISTLDRLMRKRQADQILRLDPSPLVPTSWASAIAALNKLSTSLVTEVETNLATDARMRGFFDNLPLALVLVVVGLVLLLRSGLWTERGLARLLANRKESRARFRVGAFLLSLFGMVLPFLGMMALLKAIGLSNLTGPVGEKILIVLRDTILLLLAARWLSRQVFPKNYPPRPILDLTLLQGREARVYAVTLGILIAANLAVDAMIGDALLADDGAFAARSVLRFPIIALAGLMLFRFGQILLSSLKTDQDEQSPAEAPYRILGKFLARGAMVVAVVGPVLAAVGYTVAGSAMVFSFALTLALLGAVAVLQRLSRDIYAMFAGDEAVATGLIPVLIGFTLALLAIPLLALIWGARVADLSEIWALVSNGVQLGDTRISPSDFITFAVVFAIGYGLTRLLQNTLRTQVLPRTRIDAGARNSVVAGTGYVGIFLAALIAITSAGIDLSSLAIVAGALSVGIGFGLQTIVQNFVSGIILLIERPISEGDWIEVGPTMGVVKSISVRSTTIETFDRTDVIVPNADLISGAVTNWTKGNLNGRLILPVGVAYGTDTRRVEAVLREIVEAVPGVIINPPPAVVFMGFGADSMDFEIRAILRDVNFILSTRSDINHEIARRFQEEGIEIPFAQRDVWLRNPESLQKKNPARKPSKPAPAQPSAKAARSALDEGDFDE